MSIRKKVWMLALAGLLPFAVSGGIAAQEQKPVEGQAVALAKLNTKKLSKGIRKTWVNGKEEEQEMVVDPKTGQKATLVFKILQEKLSSGETYVFNLGGMGKGKDFQPLLMALQKRLEDPAQQMIQIFSFTADMEGNVFGATVMVLAGKPGQEEVKAYNNLDMKDSKNQALLNEMADFWSK